MPLPPPPSPRRAVAPTNAPTNAPANPLADEAPVAVDGLSGSAVRTLLGPPVTQVAVGPGQTWTYRSGACEVELFLFPSVADGDLRVLDHQVNAAGSPGENQQACFRRISHDHGN